MFIPCALPLLISGSEEEEEKGRLVAVAVDAGQRQGALMTFSSNWNPALAGPVCSRIAVLLFLLLPCSFGGGGGRI